MWPRCHRTNQIVALPGHMCAWRVKCFTDTVTRQHSRKMLTVPSSMHDGAAAALCLARAARPVHLEATAATHQGPGWSVGALSGWLAGALLGRSVGRLARTAHGPQPFVFRARTLKSCASSEPSLGEKGVRSAQNIQVGPCIPAGIAARAEAGPISGPAWRLAHFGERPHVHVAERARLHLELRPTTDLWGSTGYCQ